MKNIFKEQWQKLSPDNRIAAVLFAGLAVIIFGLWLQPAPTAKEKIKASARAEQKIAANAKYRKQAEQEAAEKEWNLNRDCLYNNENTLRCDLYRTKRKLGEMPDDIKNYLGTD